MVSRSIVMRDLEPCCGFAKALVLPAKEFVGPLSLNATVSVSCIKEDRKNFEHFQNCGLSDELCVFNQNNWQQPLNRVDLGNDTR